jgi:peptidyl-prolyl cis-trans isomerase A (cyclophilin A)
MNRHFHHVAVAIALSLTAFACDKTDEPTRSTSAVAALSASAAPKAEPASASAAPTEAPVAAAAPAASESAAPVNPALLKPSAAKETAPAKFKVKFTTTKGDFVVELNRAWAPIGVDRFYNLVKLGFYNETAFFRVVPDFVVQFGIHGTPEVAAAWKPATIKDDPKSKQSNEKGTLTYAKGGPDSRTTQLFVNLKDNPRLDSMGFPPIGKITSGMNVVDAINGEYKKFPQQPLIQEQGNTYLHRAFPNLDYVKSVSIVK